MPTYVGVLVPALGTHPEPPEARPLGRAALRLATEGVHVLFGGHAVDGRLVGAIARPGAWEPAEAPVVAAYDRFPSQSQPAAHAALLAALRRVPVANAPVIVELCRDKVACQRHLEEAGLRMPEIEPDPARFAARLDEWGAAFVKPRHGAFGRGVARVERGQVPPATVDGTVPGDPAFLQRALEPPAGWAGQCARVLVQRSAAGWAAHTPVLRRSRTDPVVNAARGAEVAELPAGSALRRSIEACALAVARALDHPLAVELGVDVVVDAGGRLWPIEVNGTPRGRLEVLAAADPERWWDAHIEACARPIRYLSSAFAR